MTLRNRGSKDTLTLSPQVLVTGREIIQRRHNKEWRDLSQRKIHPRRNFLLASISCTKLFKVVLPKMHAIFLNQTLSMHTFLSTPPPFLRQFQKAP
jgi:hypothetical protein